MGTEPSTRAEQVSQEAKKRQDGQYQVYDGDSK